MSTLHFLNVREGDCSIIQHNSDRVTVVDINNARIETVIESIVREAVEKAFIRTMGANLGQKAYPVNPIEYIKRLGVQSVFRFILTHPDMDHMDGIEDLFKIFDPPNFWDTKNTCDKDSQSWEGSRFRRSDWLFYKRLQASDQSPKRLTYLSGQQPQKYWDEDGLMILAPTQALLDAANDCGEWNDASYVLLYRTNGYKVILAGDSHDATWQHILDDHYALVENVDLLLAPHHGRHSDRDFAFLDVLRPRLTLFGNASSEHLAYQAWNSRDLRLVTNNQAGSIVVDLSDEHGPWFVTNEVFARQRLGSSTFYDETRHAWLAGFLRI